MSDDTLHELRRLLHAVGAYRDDLVLVGGLVPEVYRLLGSFVSPRHTALRTDDVDFATLKNLEVRPDGTLTEVLKSGGYVILPSRASEPPCHFVQHAEFGTEELATSHAEFLVPLAGSERAPSESRIGQPPAQAECGIVLATRGKTAGTVCVR